LKIIFQHQFRCATVVTLALLVTPQANSQGMAQGAPPPSTAKSNQCHNHTLVELEDVTARAGIRFEHILAPEARYIVESMSGGVLLLDYDRDGWLDIYFTNAPTVEMALKGQKAKGALYHNNHDGTFSDVTEKSGMATPCFAMGGAVADYNNDGWPDVYITCFGGNVLYRNNGNGTFTNVTAKAGVSDGRWSMGAAFGDYDRDGYVDLMVANYTQFDLHHLPEFGGRATCEFMGIDVQCGPRGLKGAGDSLFHNKHDGTFSDVSKTAGVSDPEGYYGLSVVWADLNNTGRPDIYVANDSMANFLYRNDGKGKFTEIGLESGAALAEDGHEQASMGIAVGDYLHTGRPALFVTDFSQDNTPLYRNDGKWNFEDVSYPSGVGLPSFPWVKWGTAFVDLDNDGWLDLVTASGHIYPQIERAGREQHYKQPKLVQYNLGNGTFCDASEQSGSPILEPRVSRGLAVGDLFNDGQMDIVIENLDGRPTILRNRGVPTNHWITFELAGSVSNRSAIGARIAVTAGGITQSNEIYSGGSYISQNDLRSHFGLGHSSTVEKVEVRWPSGIVDTFGPVASDHFYAVQEQKGIVPADQIRPVPRH